MANPPPAATGLRSTMSATHATLVLALCYAVYAILLNSVGTVIPVSYTHLDVYKRQHQCSEPSSCALHEL